MKPSVFYDKAERRAEMYRVQVVIPSHESEDELGISDEEYERQAELGLVDSICSRLNVVEIIVSH